VHSTRSAPQPPPSTDRRLPVVDALRALTILWVTAFHFYADSRGVPGPDTASAAAAWAAVSEGHLVEAGAVAVRSLVALPGFRLDLLLFVTALVSMHGRPQPVLRFYARRARSILPQYWLGSVAILVLCVLLAGVRAAVGPHPFGWELHEGARLAGAPYQFAWLDVLRSLSLAGRLEDARAMQVVAPSLWYIVLVAQLLVVFPLLRRLHGMLGGPALVVLAAAVSWAGRAWAFGVEEPIPGFDANATVICFLPFRLIAPALGIVAAGWMAGPAGARLGGREPVALRWPAAAAVTAGGLAVLTGAMWLGAGVNDPATLLGVLGPALPLVIALPPLWWLATRALGHAWAGGLLRWAGARSFSILVVQDALRFVVGTVEAWDVDLAPWTFVLLPGYLTAALLLARVWHPWPEAAAVAVTGWWGASVRRKARSSLELDVVTHDGAVCVPAGSAMSLPSDGTPQANQPGPKPV
jgi:peptidoglycan/LPS O-acetylase OafA/YrhL